MKKIFAQLFIYIISPVFFVTVLFSNYSDAIEYSKGSNKWAPKLSEGPLMYDIAFTNPSRFSRENSEALLFLYHALKKELFVNKTQLPDSFKLYLRLMCDVKEDGLFSLGEYRYTCPKITLEDVSEPLDVSLCESKSEHGKVTLCDSKFDRFDSVWAYIDKEHVTLFGRDIK